MDDDLHEGAEDAAPAAAAEGVEGPVEAAEGEEGAPAAKDGEEASGEVAEGDATAVDAAEGAEGEETTGTEEPATEGPLAHYDLRY